MAKRLISNHCIYNVWRATGRQTIVFFYGLEGLDNFVCILLMEKHFFWSCEKAASAGVRPSERGKERGLV